MGVVPLHQLFRRNATLDGNWREQSTPEGLVIEAWGQGFLVGALVIMAFMTVAAMRKGVVLHRLILTEQLLAMPHGTFCFMDFRGYGWYVSSTATLLFCSYVMHNVVAWLKVRPFFVGRIPSFFGYRTGEIVQQVYLVSLGLTIPVWIFNTYNNFEWNNYTSDLYRHARPYEFVVRDPWWVFTNATLLHVIRKSYGISTLQIVRVSPRLGILLGAILVAIAFTIVDVVATIVEGALGNVDGINPYWKLSLAFKCLIDCIVLDDFAVELRRMGGDRRLPSHIRQNSIFASETMPQEDQSRIDEDLRPRLSSEVKPPPRVASGYSIPPKKSQSPDGCDLCLEIEDIGGLVSSRQSA